MTAALFTRPYERRDKAAVIALWRACALIKPWNDPEDDIAGFIAATDARLLVGELNDRIVAAAAAAYDGHRGWLYYVAVEPEHQGQGHGRAVMSAAEAWLGARGAAKAQLMIRPENQTVRDFYAALGYHAAPRSVMQKWLSPPPQAEFAGLGNCKLTLAVTFLEMRERPTGRHVPSPGGKLALIRAEPPSLNFYRYLYNTVGEPWFWWERRAMSDEALAKIVQDPRVEVYVLHVDGVPAGFAELDLRRRAEEGVVDIAYLGLVPDLIGRGYGRYLTHWSVDAAWRHEPRRVAVNTCTLDHPHALAFYQRSGFAVIGHEQRTVLDPRLTGVIPPDTPLPSTYHATQPLAGNEAGGDNVTPLPWPR